MKKIFSFSFLLLFISTNFFAQTSRPEIRKEHPSFIKLNKDQIFPKSQNQTVFQQAFNMSAVDEMRSLGTFADNMGQVHEKFQQYYNGIKVDGAIYTLHYLAGKITHMSGNYQDIQNLNVTPKINAQAGLANALGHVGATEYMWQHDEPVESHHMHDHADYKKPQGELVVLSIENYPQARLAFKYDVYATQPLYRADVYVDAHTGQVLFENNRIHHVDVAATGNSLYNGNVSFNADLNGGTYRLRQTVDGNGVQTFDLNNGTNYGSATDITSNNSNFTGNETGVQAHWGAEKTHQYYSSQHGRNSYDGNGSVLRSYVSYSSNYVNAFWDGSRMTYGDGDGVNYGPLVSLDIASHEITHGVTEFSANLVYQRESGALNESFSDIFGEMVEYHATGSNDWQMGTDIGIGGSGAIRSMDNPNAFSDPDTYGGTHWYNPNCGVPQRTNDYCGVHINSGVQNKWFYILSVGESGTNDIGSSYNVSGITREKAAAIAYRNLTVYLSTNSTFADARAGAIQSATDLYGAGSNEVIQTTNAWYAVGVGGQYGSISYCSSASTNINDEYIGRVQLNTIDNASGGQFYSDFTNISTDLDKNSQYTITVTPTWTATVYSEGYSVWIDYNADGDFGDAGEQVWTQSATQATSVSGSFTVPAGAADGATRMRVSMKYNGIPTSCETFTYGEVEDYTINIGSGGGGDTQAPSDPTGLAASNIQETTASLSWNASSDNVGVAGYNVYIGGTNIGNVTGTTANLTGLTANTSYSAYVTAFDAAGNESGASNTVNFTTDSGADTDPPSAPSNLSASNTSQTSTDLSWSASSDNVGVTSYSVYVDGSLNGTTASTSYTVSGLSAGTTYSMYVTASDAAGNTSGQSNSINVTTHSAGGGTTTVFAHFFESGWDGWIDGGSDCARINNPSNAYEGSYSIRIRDNSGTASSMTLNGLDLSGFNEVSLEFHFRPVGMENGEDFWVRYNDGSGWQTVATYAVGSGGISNNNFYVATVTLNSADFTLSNNASLRFQNDASVNNDRIYIDAVTLTGTNSSLAGFSGQSITNLGGATQGFFGNAEDENGLEIDLIVYPNPSRQFITVEADDPILSLKIFDITGALVLDVKQVTGEINVEELSSGIYVIQAITEDEVIQGKFTRE
ncbi:MAG: M4 family metallopeptidase [Bacteroidota bacterium]